jgi:hypothetical protein
VAVRRCKWSSRAANTSSKRCRLQRCSGFATLAQIALQGAAIAKCQTRAGSKRERWRDIENESAARDPKGGLEPGVLLPVQRHAETLGHARSTQGDGVDSLSLGACLWRATILGVASATEHGVDLVDGLGADNGRRLRARSIHRCRLSMHVPG